MLLRKSSSLRCSSSSVLSEMFQVIHSQRQPRNLKRMLTNSYFSRLKDTDPEVKICGTKRCGTCPYLKQGKEFTFPATNETFRIKHSMNYTSTNSRIYNILEKLNILEKKTYYSINSNITYKDEC